MRGSAVLILTGPAGVGKTTVAERLTERYELAVHIESDRFFDFIRSGFVEPWRPESQEQNAAVMAIVGDAAAAYAAAGYFTIVDGIVIPGWFFEPLRDALVQAGHPLHFAVLRAPLAECAARAATRTSQPKADPGVVEELWSQFAELGALEPHAVEVGGLSTDEATDRLAERLRAGSLAVGER